MILSGLSIWKTLNRSKSRGKLLWFWRWTKILFEFFLVNYSCSWYSFSFFLLFNQLNFFLVNHSYPLECSEKTLVNYSYFGSRPRSGTLTTIGLICFIICEDLHEQKFIEIAFDWEPNHIWLHTTLEGSWPHYMILEVVLGRPLNTFFWALTISWSRLLAHVWSGP